MLPNYAIPKLFYDFRLGLV